MMYKQIFSKLIFFIISSILLNDFLIFTNAEIKSKNESQEFLKTYCIEILNAIKDAYEIQKISVDKGDLKEFHKQGNWIGGLSTVYGNLCKK